MDQHDRDKKLRDLKRKFFGDAGAEGIPRSYLELLETLIGSNATCAGYTNPTTGGHFAYWLDGQLFGCLSCTGREDAEATAEGVVYPLSALNYAKTDVQFVHHHASGHTRWERRVTLRFGENEMTLRATGDAAGEDQTGAFINGVFNAVAGQPSSPKP